MLATELNPVGQWLLALNGGRVWALLSVKFAGTVLASGLLLWAYWHRPALGLAVATGMALFQFGLLLFLLLF